MAMLSSTDYFISTKLSYCIAYIGQKKYAVKLKSAYKESGQSEICQLLRV